MSAIADAFHQVRLNGGISVEGAKALDAYRSRESAQRISEPMWSVPWENILRKDLAPNFWALGYIDDIGWRYYLPAYMNLIVQPDGIDEELLDHLQTGMLSMENKLAERTKLFDQKQYSVLLAFFQYIARTCSVESLADDAQKLVTLLRNNGESSKGQKQ